MSAVIPSDHGLDRGAITYMAASALLGLSGQVLLKQGASAVVGQPLSIAVTEPAIWAGLVLYGAGTFFWLLVLSRVKLSVAYPFTALNYILVLIPSVLVLGEHVSALRAIGAIVIAGGVALHASALRASAPDGSL